MATSSAAFTSMPHVRSSEWTDSRRWGSSCVATTGTRTPSDSRRRSGCRSSPPPRAMRAGRNGLHGRGRRHQGTQVHDGESAGRFRAGRRHRLLSGRLLCRVHLQDQLEGRLHAAQHDVAIDVGGRQLRRHQRRDEADFPQPRGVGDAEQDALAAQARPRRRAEARGRDAKGARRRRVAQSRGPARGVHQAALRHAGRVRSGLSGER